MRKNIPIYKDDKKRKIVDNLDIINQQIDWYPSNIAALILWRCVESLRDISISLENCIQTEEISKKKRIVKNISIPLHSLAKSIIDLCNNLTSNKENSTHLSKNKLTEILKIKDSFTNLFSLDWNSDISMLRNKLAAHIDGNIWPQNANDVLLKTNESVIGTGIHICCHILIDLLEHNIYAWSCELENHPTFNIMTNEPFLVCFSTKCDKPENINCIHIINKSPKESVTELIAKTINCSQWMFSKEDMRLSGLYSNLQGNKEPFLVNAVFYNKI
jgi:hypothetical protein